jgi:hypothetical protein
MTSNDRAQKRWAISRTIRIVLRDIWWDLKRLLRNFKPSQWKWKYEGELYDIYYKAYEAEVQKASEKFVFDEIPF